MTLLKFLIPSATLAPGGLHKLPFPGLHVSLIVIVGDLVKDLLTSLQGSSVRRVQECVNLMITSEWTQNGLETVQCTLYDLTFHSFLRAGI